MLTILSKELVVAIFSGIRKRSNQRNCSIASEPRALTFLWFFESHCSSSSHATVHAHLPEFTLRMELQSGPAEGPCRTYWSACLSVPWEQGWNRCNSVSSSQLRRIPPAPRRRLPCVLRLPRQSPLPHGACSEGDTEVPELMLGKAVTLESTPDPRPFSRSLVLNHVIQDGRSTAFFCIFIGTLKKKKEKRSL